MAAGIRAPREKAHEPPVRIVHAGSRRTRGARPLVRRSNPTVGAVLVRDGVVVARGWHTAYGKSHAEVECLKDAEAKGVDPSACTLVVTLEPCNHQGQTPPCTEAVIAAGIRHVVIGLRDPNPKAAGGMERLTEAGVEVEAGVCEELCRDLVADFLIWQTTKRPYVMLKLAMTLDGRIATRHRAFPLDHRRNGPPSGA